MIHYGYIEEFIEELGTRYHIAEIAFDRWGAVQMTQNLEGLGYTVVPFGQGYRVFHAGMATPVPIANGGTGASAAKAALNNLGVFYADALPDTGTDGQICLVPV